MENLWILFVFIYAFFKGSREGIKKAALKRSSSGEILFFYTLIGFLMVAPFSFKTAISIDPVFILFVFIKSAVCCSAWFFSLKALEKMSVSLYGIMDMSRMVFSILLGVFALGESFTFPKGFGAVLVISGLFLANLKNKKEISAKEESILCVFYALLSAFFNSLSGTMDKVLMKDMDSSQLQFWFMLFMTLIYGLVFAIKKEKISISSVKRNYWIPIMSLSLILGDKLLFEANKFPQSQVTIMTLIKQSGVIVSLITGWLIFKEKHILYKLMCTLIVLGGISVAIAF